MELAEFVKARLDVDQVIAEAAQEVAPSDAELAQQAGPCVSDPAYVHIERYGPARVLREVAAKRAILARHKPLHGRYGLCCAHCSRDIDSPGLGVPWPCADVRDLVTAWSGHPDYSGDWKP